MTQRALAGLFAVLALLSGCVAPMSVAEPAASAQPVEWKPENYRLTIGDGLRIDVFREADLSLDARIDAAGMINYPLLGLVPAAGLTARELEIQITQKLSTGFLKNPDVRVIVTRFRPVFVTGAVRSSGSYPYSDALTVEKAITLAGGLTPLASQRRIYVLRDGRPHQSRERVELDALLYPGDTLLVEEGIF